MKKTTKKVRPKGLKSPLEIGHAIGIDDPVDVALFSYKADLSILAVKTIRESGYSISDLSKKAGVARSKVSAIANGAVVGMSHELFLKIIIACGKQIITKAA